MKNRENLVYVIFLSSVAALGGFLFGYDTAVISGTIKSVSTQFKMDEVATGWYVGCALIGCILGVSIAGKSSDMFGRRPILMFAAVLFTSSSIGCMLSHDEFSLIAYRLLGGVGIGIASIISPLYISEIAISRYRGTLVTLYQLAITVGFLSAYLVNYAILDNALNTGSVSDGLLNKIWISEYWRGMLGAETLPAFLFLVVLFLIPESPRWLIIKNKEEKASHIMSRIYGDEGKEAHILDLKKLIANEIKSDWKLLLKPEIRKMVVIGMCIAILGQFMGVNAVLYYGPSIFEQTGLSEGDSLFYQVIVGVINVVGTIVGMWLVDRIGRKKLVYFGVSGMMISLIAIGLYFIINKSEIILPQITLLVLILMYIFSCAISICIVIWVLLSEMYPVRVRGAAMSIAGFSLWVGTYLIGQLTPWLMLNLSPAFVFWLFCLMCVPYMLIIWKLVPETTGKSLEEIERNIS